MITETSLYVKKERKKNKFSGNHGDTVVQQLYLNGMSKLYNVGCPLF